MQTWPDMESFGTNHALCSTWSNGAMLAGINAVLGEYAAKAALVIDRRLRARAFN